MKKILIILCASLLLFLISGCGTINNTSDGKSLLYWIPEESGFVNYEITDEKIKFSYSICFVNDSQDIQTISLSAKFASEELRGWVKNTGFFLGCDENGEMLSEKISPNTKKNITFYFEGEYLGGTINDKLSFPCEIIILN